MSYSVVIPSNNAERLKASMKRVLEMEPDFNAESLVVIDDGLDWSKVHDPCPMDELCYAPHIVGPKPFIFGRNCNLGLEECARRGHDAILMNDDALLETPGGFSALSRMMTHGDVPNYLVYKDIGILSPTINSVGNHRQAIRSHPKGFLINEPRMLCFVCVYIRHEVFAGPNPIRFDERYVDYGMDDDDFSRQALSAGWRLGILDTVRIDHTTLQSAYRGSGAGDFRPNLKRFIQKWGTDNWGKSKEQSDFPECFPY